MTTVTEFFEWARMVIKRYDSEENAKRFRTESTCLIARLEAAEKLLQDIEKWEAKWILDDESWDTSDGLPKLTTALYDEWLTLQDRRSKIIKGGK